MLIRLALSGIRKTMQRRANIESVRGDGVRRRSLEPVKREFSLVLYARAPANDFPTFQNSGTVARKQHDSELTALGGGSMLVVVQRSVSKSQAREN